jgi:argininosuccinate lyase
MPLWDGRFTGSPSDDMVAFSESLSIDLDMWRQDIRGSRAHATMLGEVGLLTAEEVSLILDGLDQVARELEDGRYRPGPELEDVHMAVESRLIELIGPAGGRLHTARSRNDQVATDVRLYLKDHLPALRDGLRALAATLVDRAERDGAALIPGFTHLQRGQPIRLGHHLLAHAWAVTRDAERVADALRRLDVCPLGAGAMAGTPHPIDRHRTASLLGFRGPIENAMDAVSARDHQLEVAAACAIAMSTLSRMAEELVLWSTEEFAFVRVADGYATGSSIMPQKRNPDAAELVRGKSGRVFGALQALLVMVKGLPMAYNRDLQEDRRQLFDALATTSACARITEGMFRTLEFRPHRWDLSGQFLLATEIADHLVQRGVPFREAHHVSGRIVADRERAGRDLRGMTVADFQAYHPSFGDDVLQWLEPGAAADRRTSYGGTALSEVSRQITLLRQQLSTLA